MVDTAEANLATAQANLAIAEAELVDALANAGSDGSGITAEYTNSTNLPTGRDFGTKRYQNDGDIIPNYIHTDFPNR